MKKVSLIVLVLVVSCVCCFAKVAKFELADVVSAEEKFNSQQLTIVEAKKYTLFNGIYGDVSNDWKAYCGPNVIKKSEFFEIAGYADLAKQIKAIERKNKMLIVGSAGCFGIGLISYAANMIGLEDIDAGDYGYNYSEYQDAISKKTTGAIAGLVLGTVGGVICMCLIESIDISPEFAMNVSTDYNNSLAVSLDYHLN